MASGSRFEDAYARPKGPVRLETYIVRLHLPAKARPRSSTRTASLTSHGFANNSQAAIGRHDAVGVVQLLGDPQCLLGVADALSEIATLGQRLRQACTEHHRRVPR